LFGIILGAVLTVGAAYVVDHVSIRTAAAGTTSERTMVNWDVVADNWRILKDRARDGWSRLSKLSTG
jgi:hypothetical protein